jgi:hypothetical protein
MCEWKLDPGYAYSYSGSGLKNWGVTQVEEVVGSGLGESGKVEYGGTWSTHAPLTNHQLCHMIFLNQDNLFDLLICY